MGIIMHKAGNYQIHFDDGTIIYLSNSCDFIAAIGSAYITTSNAWLYFKDKIITGVFNEKYEEKPYDF